MLLVILSFIFREKKRVKIYCENDHDATETALRCIGVDGKIDGSTLTYVEDGNNNLKKISCSEHHLTITNEPGIISGMYLDHVTLPQDGNTAFTMAEKFLLLSTTTRVSITSRPFWWTTRLLTQDGKVGSFLS